MVSAHFSRPKWLFFDLDDTLWDFKRNSLESLRHVYSRFPEINGRFDTFESFSDVYHQHNSSLWKDFADGKVTSELLKSERWRRTLYPRADPMSPPGACMDIDREYLRFLAEQPYLVDGAEEVLESLSKRFMIGVLSNGFIDTQYRKLRYSGLWKYVARTVVSDEAGFQKPDPRLYQYAVGATGATGTPIMIGDNPQTDILGALRAGWQAVWYNPDGMEFPLSEEDLKKEGIDAALYLGSISKISQLPSSLLPFFPDCLFGKGDTV